LKAAGSVISHVLIEHNGNFRSAATQMGANHSTLSRFIKKFNRNYNKKPLSSRKHSTSGERATAA
jgi:23S rRNA U2552 (ribose-2'-O)-methylase RlmE/FtsJ